MTLWVGREGQQVTIHGNIGLDVKVQAGMVREFAVNEHASHLRHFWGQLGKALEEAEAELNPPPLAVHEPGPGGF
jgi:hypothetical protein